MIVLCLVLLLVILLSPIPVDGQDGMYNFTSRLAWCRTRPACIHEVAHALDQQAGWVSRSDDFYKTLEWYLFVEIYSRGVTPLSVGILEITYRGDGASAPIKRELYAYIFLMAEGDPQQMPEAFRPFYDWQRAGQYMQLLNTEQSFYWFI
jgi:hypothetical protein